MSDPRDNGVPDPTEKQYTRGQTRLGFGLLAAAALSILAVVAWDWYALSRKGVWTVSRWTLETSRRYTIVAFGLGLLLGLAVGCLAGHLEWPQLVYLKESP